MQYKDYHAHESIHYPRDTKNHFQSRYLFYSTEVPTTYAFYIMLLLTPSNSLFSTHRRKDDKSDKTASLHTLCIR